MSQLYDRESLGRIFESIKQMRDRLGETIDDSSQGVPLGFKQLSDDEFVQFVLDQVLTWPPVEITDLNGVTVESNPWLAMLTECENGPELLRRFERITGAKPGGAA